ncbi:acyl-CoA dehydrogenase family protein [bacterium]|nr:acyl-CoA dehydrogenase family protein [bacterium]
MNFFSDKIKDSLALFSSDSGKYSDFLDEIGKICGGKIAANAAKVDKIGVKLEKNSVILPAETLENIGNLKNCGYLGAVLPEIRGGKSLPKLFDVAAIEMISRADASLMTLVSLQEIGRIIDLYGTEEQKNRILPGIAGGKLSCAMALSETCAGSDLQAVETVAREENGVWYLSGTKHFVTNADADIMLVLAGSEEGISGGRSLSLFIREKGADDNCRILKTAEKHGICGSPTCDIRFEKAKCELLGRRRFGLVKYTMELLLSARLSVAAQALGIAEAALQEAEKYAEHRVQFGKKIAELPQIARMLEEMNENLRSARLLLYFTAAKYDEMQKFLVSPQTPETAEKAREIRSLVEFLVPLVKFFAAVTAEKVARDALQIHGGTGYVRGVAVERFVRDSRVTSIYEGTNQIQISAVVRKTADGTLEKFAEQILSGKENSETDRKIASRVKRLTLLASNLSENGKIEFCEKELAFSSAFLSVAILASAYESEKFSSGNFFSRLLAKVDFFISVIEAM